MLQVRAASKTQTQLFLVDPNGGSLTINASGGAGGAGGSGGRGGRGGFGGAAQESAKSSGVECVGCYANASSNVPSILFSALITFAPASASTRD